MSSRSPAAQLARLKVTYPLWEIGRLSVLDPEGLAKIGVEEMFIARRRRDRLGLLGATPADLENELIRAGWGG